MTSPNCDGQKQTYAHVRTSTGGGWRWLKCHTCDGVGTITVEQAHRIAEGERRREDRKSRMMTLREEAARLGISPTELSRIENGRVDS